MPDKIDLRKELKHLYRPSPKKPVIVEVPAFNFLMVDGQGDPNTSIEFKEAIETLFPFSYNLKFAVKKRTGVDYSVMPLEGRWWGTPKELTQFTAEDKAKWKWTLMMVQPEYITQVLVDEFFEVLVKKNLSSLSKVRFETFDEGWVIQMMHIGPFDDEWKTVEIMDSFVKEQGYKKIGKHHEIYLSDFRRTAPEKLKTVLRHQIKKNNC